jgi:hypothetical protein
MLMASLTDASSFDVRFNAVKASVNYLLLHEKEANIHKHFQDLLVPILTVRVPYYTMSFFVLVIITALHRMFIVL